jgi:hypothetical protein
MLHWIAIKSLFASSVVRMQTANLFALLQTFIFIYLVSENPQPNQVYSFVSFFHRKEKKKIFGWFLLFNSHAFLPFSSFFTNKACKYTHPYWNEHMTMSEFYLFMMVLCVPFWLLFGLSNQLLNCVIWIIYDYSLEKTWNFLFLTFKYCFFFLPSSSPTYIHISLRTTDFFPFFLLLSREWMYEWCFFHVGILCTLHMLKANTLLCNFYSYLRR